MFNKKFGQILFLCDIHCHIMYGVDDGAKNKEQSCRMLELAYKEGIRNIILTPHYKMSYEDEEQEIIRRRFRKLQQHVQQKYEGMNLYQGNEILYYEGVAKDLMSGNAHSMAGSRYVLIEFMPGTPYSYVKNAVADMLRHDYTPIIAHIERYDCLLKDFDKVWELKERGALVQVNANSVMGKHGGKEKRFCRKLLKCGLVDFIATDAHRDDMRKPELAECAKWMVHRFGEEEARVLFEINPLKIIHNEEITEE